jgi:hypothetical protein
MASRPLDTKLLKKIDEGKAYVERLEKKLDPLIEYLCNQCVEKKEELPPDKCFEYLIRFMSVKTESLLLLTKLQEVLDYTKKHEKNFEFFN